MNYVFGIDVGGTTVKMGLFSKDGQLLDKWEINTRIEQGGDFIIPDIAYSILTKMKEKNIDIPNKEMEKVTKNLGWGKKNVSLELGDLLDVEVLLGNDANVAALGEMWLGAGRGNDSIFMVTLGTGVGGGVVVDGKSITGSHGTAGEIGHITVNYEETLMCNCGKAGCLEQYASATGITRLGNKLLLESDEPSSLREFEDLSSKVIFDMAKEGDKLALDLVDEFGRYLGIALSYVASLIDPQIFVIGGGVSKAGNIIIDVTSKHYKNFVMKSIKETEFILATLGNDAGTYGSARMVIPD